MAVGHIQGLVPRLSGLDSGHEASLVLCPQFRKCRSKGQIRKGPVALEAALDAVQAASLPAPAQLRIVLPIPRYVYSDVSSTYFRFQLCVYRFAAGLPDCLRVQWKQVATAASHSSQAPVGCTRGEGNIHPFFPQ